VTRLRTGRRGFDPRQEKGFLSSPSRPAPKPPIQLVPGALSARLKQPRLRMRGATHLLPHTSSWPPQIRSSCPDLHWATETMNTNYISGGHLRWGIGCLVILYLNRTTEHTKDGQTSMPRVEFEPTIPESDRPKTILGLDPASNSYPFQRTLTPSYDTMLISISS
jgi:hypothetical protein